ncbi:MAG: acyl-[acyl-carrier-protein]--UDP-N-acetylglucosamine O-acyltransferase [Candidatus Omnitrophica bacterium CG_4_9_14_0_2_um_filter_42_8]|nr:MAG: acyl-[acyl-carrier-protein]--UDP-N-acetylglucosamine O-acyltransferase [Candidatus Omnitrophica bacterium CG22_combo_CG10-13_8_21_14_all_43_16]PJC48223.1 MAG: acyl-[acyl-carrier-protein]--UDP-N-acetylglucosamine O-acyltransferase [Candidatus Omnitrophica bacterium CG_4_9_14_0_2_um_filter_42_8]
MNKIHPTAIVDKKAKLADDVEVGPYAIIGPNVEIGKGAVVGPAANIEGYTTLGEGSRIFTGAIIGSPPQDLKYKGEKSFLKIGKNNTIREYVTMNLGTEEGTATCVGDDNLFMAYSHVAHNCRVGNNCVIANAGTLAGHVTLEDKVVLGGFAGVHQFTRVGKMSIIGGCSKVVQDIPPFSTCDGNPARVYGLNLIGVRRAGMSQKAQAELKKAFKILFHSGLALKNGIAKVKKEIASMEEVEYLLNFLKDSERGICRGGK